MCKGILQQEEMDLVVQHPAAVEKTDVLFRGLPSSCGIVPDHMSFHSAMRSPEISLALDGLL